MNDISHVGFTLQDDSISEADERTLEEAFGRMKELLERPEYVKFNYLGSGLQKHYGHVTVARQDCYGSVDEAESAMWYAIEIVS